MPVARAFAIEGIKLWFWSDDHDPPHVHAKKSGDWEVKVHFLLNPDQMMEIEWTEKRPASRTLNTICLLAEQHRVELLEQWEGIHQRRAQE